MARGTLNLIEQHIEKALLGVAGLALLTMAFLYLISTPNTVPYAGEEVSAGDLDAAILADAQELRDAGYRKKPDVVEVPDFSGDLDRQFQEGILGSARAASALKPDLRLAADFGEPIPTLIDDEEARHNVVLVTPLKPSQPKLRTGRVLALRKPPALAGALTPLGAEAQPEEEPEESDEPVELAYVSLAAYFPREAQRDAMIAASYAPFRSRVYVVGNDVQRQEMLANGEFSAWQDVTNSKATPRLEIPALHFNEETSDIDNDQEIDEAYTLVKASQVEIMQPEFYDVYAGDFWEIPPLAGFEEEDEEEVKVAVKPRKQKEPKRRPRPSAPRPSGGAVGVGGGGTVGVAGGGGGGRISRGRDTGAARERQQKKDAQKRIREELKEANDSLKRKEFDRAEQTAKRIVDHEHATRGDINKAQGIIDRIEKYRRQQARRAGVRPSSPSATPGGLSVAGAGPSGLSVAGAGPAGHPAGPLGGPPARGSEQDVSLITRPGDDNQVAVWFHDDTVEAGKTYRYRMRVKLWNRYVGKMAALKNAEQAKQSVLVGEWSLPSDSITVTPSTYFFAGGPTTSKDGARVEVWKWRKGEWIRETFNVSVGDVIGNVQRVKTGEFDEDLKDIKDDVDFTTGAIVLDILYDEPVTLRQAAGKKGQFNLRDRESMVVVYLDPADGQVKQRVADLDRYDPIYKKLKDLEF